MAETAKKRDARPAQEVVVQSGNEIAAAAGGRVFNATSANGLLFALEQLPVQSGTRFPMVFNIVTRSVSGPLDIRGDHSDIMLAMNTGWIILMASDAQGGYHMHLMAPRIGERTSR